MYYYALDYGHNNIGAYYGSPAIGNDVMAADVHVFDGRAERNAWVAADPYTYGKPSREETDAKTAKRGIRNAVWNIDNSIAYDNDIDDMIEAYADAYPYRIHI